MRTKSAPSARFFPSHSGLQTFGVEASLDLPNGVYGAPNHWNCRLDFFHRFLATIREDTHDELALSMQNTLSRHERSLARCGKNLTRNRWKLCLEQLNIIIGHTRHLIVILNPNQTAFVSLMYPPPHISSQKRV